MPVKAECPSCGATYNLPEQLAGKRVRCKRCSTTFLTEDQAAVELDDIEDDATVEDDEPTAQKEVWTKSKTRSGRSSRRSDDDEPVTRRRKKAGNDQTALVVGGLLCGGALILVLLVGGIFLLMRGRNAAVPGQAAVGNPAGIMEANAQPGMPVQQVGKPQDAVARSGWQVSVDPAPARGQPVETAKLAIPVEPGIEVQFPTSPSAFVAIGRNILDADNRTLYDLRTGQRAGNLSGKLGGFFKTAVSPDGEQFAAIPPTSLQAVDVWSFKTGQRVSRIEMPTKGFIDLMDFGGPGEVVTVTSGEQGKKVVRVWSTTNGQKLREIQGKLSIYSQEYALSPGRRYLALFGDKALHLFDLKEGTESEVDVAGPGFETCQAIAFSPDGTLLAASMMAGAKGRIVALDVARGTVVADLSFPQPLNLMVPNAFNHQGSHLEWLSDNSGWLVHGDTVIDRKTGQPRFSVSGSGIKTSIGPTRLVSNGQILAVVAGQGFSSALTSVSFAGKETGGSAGAMGDQPGARPVTAGDWSGARRLQAAAGTTGALKPDPRPGARGRFAMPLELGIGDKTASSQGPIRILFSRPDVGQVVTVTANATPNKFVPHSWRADRYDLLTSKRLGGIDPITQAPQTLSMVTFAFAEVSPDGARLIVRDMTQEGRLDLFTLEDGKPLVNWLPYEKETAARVTWAAFSDAGHVWTINDSGKLALWDVPACKVVATLDATAHATPALSAGGSYLAIATGSGIDILDARTGEPRGRLGFPAGLSSLQGLVLAWRPDGKELAAIVQTADGDASRSLVVRWDLATGMTTDQFSLKGRFAFATSQYCGDGHLLLNGMDLLDLRDKGIYVRYQPTGVTATRSPDARTWFSSRGPGGTFLGARLLPDEKGKQLAAQLKAAPVVVEPGAGVAVEVQANGTVADMADIQKRITDAVGKPLKSAGLEAAAAGPLHLVLGFQERDTGEVFKLEGIGANRTTYNVPIKKLSCTATLTDATGSVVWQTKGEQTTRSFFGIRRFTEEPTLALLKELWQIAPAWAATLTIPGHAVRTGTRTLFLPVGTPLTPGQ